MEFSTRQERPSPRRDESSQLSSDPVSRRADALELINAVDRDRATVENHIGFIAAQLHALEAELTVELSAFDALGGWQCPDFQTMANWMTIRTGHTLIDAQRFCRVADRLERIPTLMDAARNGRIGIGMLDVAARISTPENESRIAHIVIETTPSQAARILRKYRNVQEQPNLRQDDEQTGGVGDRSGTRRGARSNPVARCERGHAADDPCDVCHPDNSGVDWPSNRSNEETDRGAEPAPCEEPGTPSADPGTPSAESASISGWAGLPPSAGPVHHPGEQVSKPTPIGEYWWRNWTDDQGRHRIDACLDPVTSALLERAVTAARSAHERECQTVDPDGEQLGTLNSDTPDTCELIRRLANTMIDSAHQTGLSAPNGERFAVQITADLATVAAVLGLEINNRLPIQLGSQAFLATTGQHLTDRELATILCDANVQLLIAHEGVPLWMGTEQRSFNRFQRRAMAHRTGGTPGCEFPGCTHTRHLDAHHVTYASNGGATDLANGVLLCSWHHRRLHHGHYVIATNGDQAFDFWDATSAPHRFLGSSHRSDRPGKSPPHLEQPLPLVNAPPASPLGIGPDTPRSATNGEKLTSYVLDTYLHHLLTA